jgi:Phage integrase family
LQRDQDPKSPFVFTSERGSPFTTAGFARMVGRAGVGAKLGFPAHPHMLRHACGFALANQGHDTRALQAYLGHRNIQHTVRYTELSPGRFKDFWRSPNPLGPPVGDNCPSPSPSRQIFSGRFLRTGSRSDVVLRRAGKSPIGKPCGRVCKPCGAHRLASAPASHRD